MAPTACAVKGCKSNSRKNLQIHRWMKDVVFFSFPKKRSADKFTKRLREKWIEAIRQDDGWEPRNTRHARHVCSLHFSMQRPTPERPIPDLFPWGQVVPDMSDLLEILRSSDAEMQAIGKVPPKLQRNLLLHKSKTARILKHDNESWGYWDSATLSSALSGYLDGLTPEEKESLPPEEVIAILRLKKAVKSPKGSGNIILKGTLEEKYVPKTDLGRSELSPKAQSKSVDFLLNGNHNLIEILDKCQTEKNNPQIDTSSKSLNLTNADESASTLHKKTAIVTKGLNVKTPLKSFTLTNFPINVQTPPSKTNGQISLLKVPLKPLAKIDKIAQNKSGAGRIIINSDSPSSLLKSFPLTQVATDNQNISKNIETVIDYKCKQALVKPELVSANKRGSSTFPCASSNEQGKEASESDAQLDTVPKKVIRYQDLQKLAIQQGKILKLTKADLTASPDSNIKKIMSIKSNENPKMTSVGHTGKIIKLVKVVTPITERADCSKTMNNSIQLLNLNKSELQSFGKTPDLTAGNKVAFVEDKIVAISPNSLQANQISTPNLLTGVDKQQENNSAGSSNDTRNPYSNILAAPDFISYSSEPKSHSHAGKMSSDAKLEGSRVARLPQKNTNVATAARLVNHVPLKCFTCPPCKKIFTSQEDIREHNINVHSRFFRAAKETCQICDGGFEDKSSLTRHVDFFKKETCPRKRPTYFVNAKGIKEAIILTTMCTICMKVFKTKDELHTHCAAVHTVERLKKLLAWKNAPTLGCPMCGKVCINLEEFLHHIDNQQRKVPHNAEAVSEEEEKEGETPIASNDLSDDENPKYLAEGEFTHENSCVHCDRLFSGRNSRRKHELEHGVGYKCKYCDKSFPYRNYLVGHLRTHTGEKHYKCKQCDARFSLSNQLTNHVNKEHNKMVFECEICGRRFSSISGLRSHDTIHSGVKKHVCSYCGKTFRLSGTLKAHEKVHFDRKKDHVCDFCGKGFTEKQYLYYHLKRCSEVK